MRKLIAIISYIFISLLGFAQSKVETPAPSDFDYKKTNSSYIHVYLGFDDLENKVANHMKKTNTNLTDNKTTLVLDTAIESLTGWHFTYHQNYDGKEIYNSQIKVNTDNDGTITSVFDYSFSSDLITSNAFPNTYIINSQLNNYQILNESQLIYLFNNEKLTPAALIFHLEDEDYPFALAIDNTGTIIYEKDLSLYFDSAVTGTVFLPDPLTKAGVSYGIPFVDNNDNDVPQLNAQIDTVSLTANYDSSSGVFLLESNAVLITEHSSPTINPVTSLNGEFYYTRSESGFEDINAFYHINRMQNHIQTLGFNNIVNYQINIDTHGLNGSDNSNFQSSFNPPRITFGEGGVDDAEDADVILHEYGHAIMNSAAPGTNTGTERATLDEANGDYFAASFSRSLNSNSWDSVYTWDGHNEYWDGRMASSDKHYPEDLVGNLYTDTDIWSSTIMQIWEDLGRNTTDQLLIESAYGYASGMTMLDAAALFYQADVDLNNGANYLSICNRFQSRGLMGTCPNSVNEHTISLGSKLLNSQSFAKGSDNAIILLNRTEETLISIYNINGQLIKSSTHHTDEISISPADHKAGVYLVEIIGASGREIFKLVRF